MVYITKEQFKQLMRQHPEENPEVLVNEIIGQGHQLEGLNDTPEDNSMFKQAADLGIGAAKGAGRTVMAIAPLVNPVIGKALSIGGAGEKINKALEPTNKGQKIGGYVETGAELLTGTGVAKQLLKAPKALKVLKMSPAELKKVAGTGLEYLKEKSLRKLPIKGGGFTSAEYSMPQQIESLAKEFKNILSPNLEKTKQNAVKLGKEYYQKTIKLFEGNNNTINLKSLKSKLEQSIREDTSTVYGQDIDEIVNKSVKVFMNNVKSGTAKGLEEARVAWRSEKKLATGKLSAANEKIHSVLKSVIKKQLPEDKQILYDAFKQKQAKLFDIQDIVDAKKAAKIGTSKLKSAAKKAGAIAGGILAWEGAKKIFK